MNANNARSTQSMNGTNSSFETNGKVGASGTLEGASASDARGESRSASTASMVSATREKASSTIAASGANSVISSSKVVSRRHNQLSFRRMLAALGCMVVVVMAVALMVPAVSMTHGELVCDLEEHAHTDKCYEKVLICGMEEGEGAVPATDEEPAVEGHKHTKDCYEKQLVCDTPEHKHSDSCYAEPEPEPEPEPTAEPAPGEEGGESVGGDFPEPTADAGDEADPNGQPDADATDVTPAEPASDESEAKQVEDGTQAFHGELKDANGKVTLAVDAEAPAGSLPQGATMKLKAVKRAKVEDAVDAALSDAAARVSDGAAATDAERLAAAKSNAKVESIQAVDIAFFDEVGNEIEPTSDVSVRLSSDQIKKYVEGAGAEGAQDAAASAGVAKDVAARPLLVHIANDGAAAMVDVLAKQDLKARDLPTAAKDELVFAAPGFSVYALVYTVDFHWEVDGQTYDFSIPVGGFVGLADLVNMLGITSDTASAEEGSEDTSDFLANVESVEFSNPELVWVGKVDEDNTVGGLKEANELDCQYSAELTEEQIAENNAQTVKAGDWALISMQPFTSEETLTITMRNGDVFEVKVTDAQKSDASLLEEGEQYVLYIVYNGNYYALDGDGNTVQVPNNNLDNLSSGYLWTYDFKPKAEDPSLTTDGCAWANGSNYLDVYWSFEDQNFQSKYNPVAPTSDGWTPIAKLAPASDGGFYFSDVNDDTRYLYFDADRTHIRTCHVSEHQDHYHYVPNPVSVHIYKQEATYTVTCKTGNAEYGSVRYTHAGNTQQTTASAPSFNVTTEKNDSDNKQIPDNIAAVPEPGYKFTGWTVINESGNEYEVTDWGDGCTSESATIRPTVSGNLTLQANFAPERQYTFTVKTNNTEMGTVGGGDSNGVVVTNQDSFESISTAVINNVGLNTYELTAAKKPLHKFVKWELRDANGDPVQLRNANGDLVEDTTPTIDAKSIRLTEDNMTLTAVFAKKTETEIDNDDINILIDDWKEDLTNDFVGVDKTAHVHDYENRIYEIDLSASSGKWAVERSINLDFITDTSRSMYFPANLEYAKNNNEDESTFTNLASWLRDNGDTDETYYVISAIYGTENSATMYAITYRDNKWQWIDSSYHYYINAGGTDHSYQEVPNSTSMDGKTLTGKIYKSSDPTNPYTSHTTPSSLNEYWSRLDYLYKAVMTATEVLKTIDPNSKVGLTTFNKGSKNEGLLGSTEQEIYNKLKNISPQGGTRQDRGLWTARIGTDIDRNASDNPDTTPGPGANSVFQSNSANQQFAIIVTDGAPNGAQWGNNNSGIKQQANLLKNITDSSGKKLTLMTLGVGSDFVGSNKGQFDSLASESKYAENANNGGEIVRAIQDLVRSMVKRAELFGTVSDTLDPAFYPVDRNGNPITAGTYKNGQPYTPSANDTSEYYEWSQTGEVWTITYHNQTFKWPEMDNAGNITTNGWEGSFFVKTKENFMGGNTIETNKTTESEPGTTFTATHTILLDDNGQERPETKKEIKNAQNQAESIVKNDIPTPRVNIKQLTLDSNDTQWTVYTETNVYPPIDQIKELFNIIKVSEVVNASTDNMITSNTAMMFEPGMGTVPETFLLKDVIDVTNEDWDDLMRLNGGDGTVDIPYTAYGHAPGVIRLTLAKEGDNADYSAHATSSSPNAVERYVLTAQYVPYTVEEMQGKDADGGAYHTTSGQEPGAVQQDGKKSINTHIIDLFTRGISITKTDETFATGIPGAEFMVYRPATEDEIHSTDLEIQAKLKTFDGDSATYFADHELDFDARGVAYKNGVKAYGGTTKYYLVETKAPAGYNLLEDPIPVALTITDSYTIMPVAEGVTPTPQDTKPVSGLFNWEQKATLMLTGEAGFIRTTAAYDPNDPSTNLTNTGIMPTSLYEVMYYRIANTSGVELPYTGGQGTDMFHLLGIMLISIAGVGFAMKRSRRNAA